MIPNSMARFPPPPDTGERPIMWKSLGIIAQSQSGFIEAAYALDTFRGDLDVDTEAEVRGACHSLLGALTQTGRAIDPDAVHVLQRRRGFLKVRLVAGYWGEPNTVAGRM